MDPRAPWSTSLPKIVSFSLSQTLSCGSKEHHREDTQVSTCAITGTCTHMYPTQHTHTHTHGKMAHLMIFSYFQTNSYLVSTLSPMDLDPPLENAILCKSASIHTQRELALTLE